MDSGTPSRRLDDLSAILQLIEAHDQRHSERLKSVQEMMNLALEAQKQLADRTEESFERRLEAMNHFRAEFRSSIGTLATKKELEALFEVVRVNTSRLDIIEGRNKGVGLVWSVMIGAVGVIGGIVSTVVVISKGLL